MGFKLGSERGNYAVSGEIRTIEHGLNQTIKVSSLSPAGAS